MDAAELAADEAEAAADEAEAVTDELDAAADDEEAATDEVEALALDDPSPGTNSEIIEGATTFDEGCKAAAGVEVGDKVEIPVTTTVSVDVCCIDGGTTTTVVISVFVSLASGAELVAAAVVSGAVVVA